MMLQIQQLGFTMSDLMQYLDTHPFYSFAMQRYNMTTELYQKQVDAYGKTYGPIVQMYSNSGETDSWQWALYDFPWGY